MVAAELSRRGYIATTFTGNLPYYDIIAVDDLLQGDKFANLADCEIADYIDKDAFAETLEDGALNGAVEVMLHQGACSDTTELDGRYLVRQMGIVRLANGRPLAASIATLPGDGSFETGTANLTQIARWLIAHVDASSVPPEECRRISRPRPEG